MKQIKGIDNTETTIIELMFDDNAAHTKQNLILGMHVSIMLSPDRGLLLSISYKINKSIY